jgi:hypothetical protein
MTTSFTCTNCGHTQHARFDGEPVDCQNCGYALPCPVCSDDNEPAGWFRTDDNDVLPCHGCNAREMAAQRRRGV